MYETFKLEPFAPYESSPTDNLFFFLIKAVTECSLVIRLIVSNNHAQLNGMKFVGKIMAYGN